LAQGMVAQSVLNRVVDFSCTECLPAGALLQLSRETSVPIVFSDRFFDQCQSFSMDVKSASIKQILDQITACGRVSYKTVGSQIVFYRKSTKRTLSGYIEDAATGERLIGATIRVLTQENLGAVSNEFGFFSMKLDESEHHALLGSYVGYRQERVHLSLHSDRIIHLKLQQDSKLPEVVIPAYSAQEEKERKSGSPTYLNLQALRMIPMPGGEADLLRQTALQPGIQTGTDGLGGMHVRGGNADQNLFLLDDVPVYSPSHALGLFSIFNPSTVSSVRLWKGDFPARYSGRASSVLDVRTREGNLQEYKAQVSAGLFASSAVVEGPIVKGKGSFLLGGRYTYFEPWVDFFSKRGNLLTFSGDEVQYRFYDSNLKLNYSLSDKDRLYFSFYYGGDLFKNKFVQNYSDANGYITDRSTLATDWGNSIAALRWNHLLKENLFTNTTIRYSRFFYQSRLGFLSNILYPNLKEAQLANYGQLYQTLIRDWSGKTDFTFYVSKPLTLRWGVSYTTHNFQPGALSANFLQPGQTQTNVDSLANILQNNERLQASEAEAYFDAEWEIVPRLRLEAGLNGSVFQIKSTNYRLLQPRLRLRHEGREGWNEWIGFHRTAQNLHQIGTFNISLPFELWVPSTSKVPPEKVWQFSTGVGWQKNGWSWQVEGYFKDFEQVLTFISSGDALFTGGAVDASGWEDRIAVGSGKSRGLECMIEKTAGKTTGAIAYTLSRSTRLFNDINSSRPFPLRYDRTHDVKITLRQQLFHWLEADVVWGFATGNPITLTGVKFRHKSVEGEVERDVFFYTEVNGFRLPNYHRLDVALNASFATGRVKHAIQLGAYNTYNRANPFYLYVDAGSSVKGKAIQFTLLPLLPVLRYEIKL
jgi:CarboxypepD_reg-like domain/TonB dependent receptor/TonB-dependent Receptor Plug Domain